MLHLRAVKPRGLQKTPFPPGAAFLSVCLAAARRGIASGVRSSPLWLCPWLIACSEAGSPPPPPENSTHPLSSAASDVYKRQVQTRSTLCKDIHIDVCSACHPFFTGKQKIVDSGGRVDRFKKRFGSRGAKR